MFRAPLCPSSGAPSTAFAASGYRMVVLLVNRPRVEAHPTRQPEAAKAVG
jgi:hypothetical protein